jgi:arsenate reductase (glutaredoxin)
MDIVVYGIKNCNTVKSALEWLNERKVQYQFHDYKAKGIEEAKLRKWCAEVGWESLVNKRGTTWRQLDPKVQGRVRDQASAIALMKEKTSVIKRPLIESGNKIIALGFESAAYEKALGRK